VGNSIYSILNNDFNINQTELYLCNELNTKLIYENIHNLKVVGIASSINGKIIEVIDRKKIGNKRYYKININEFLQGWISLEKSVRLYRIPMMIGEVISEKAGGDFTINYNIQDYLNKKLEARYYFESNQKQYILINRVGHRERKCPVLLEQFYKYMMVKEKYYVSLESGDSLFSTAFDNEPVEFVVSDTNVKVIGFYQELNKSKVRYNNKIYWINKHINLEEKEKSSLIDNLELIDKIMYLKSTSYKQKLKIESQERSIKEIKDNIVISNNLQEMYLNKYLGDQYDSE